MRTEDLQTLAELLAPPRPGAGAAFYLCAADEAGEGRAGEEGRPARFAAGAGSLAEERAELAALASSAALPHAAQALPGPACLLAVPVDRDGERLGALFASPGQGYMAPDEWAARLERAADLAATLVCARRDEDEARRRQAALDALEEVGSAVERATTTEEVLEAIFDSSVRALRCDTASLFVVDEQGESLHMLAGRNVPTAVVQSSRFRMGEGVAGWVAAQNRPVIVPDVMRDPRYRLPDSGLDESRSLLVVPLRLRGEVIATLCYARRGTNAFQPPDLDLAEKMAVYAAQVLEQARLLKLQAKAEALRVRFESLSAISHDIRTSLTHVKLAAKLAEHTAGDGKRQELLAMVVDKIDDISRLLNAGLEASRLEGQLVRLQIAPTPLGELVQDVVAELSPRLTPRHRLEVLIPPSLTIQVDRVQMRRVLINLLDNAVKYSPEGGAIEVKAERLGTIVHLSVRDEGVGIPEQHLERVFEQFFRTPEVGASPGYGLGLYTCRRVVEAHGGSLRAESTPGAGCTIHVVLPVSPLATATQRPRPRGRRGGSATGRTAAGR